MRGQACSHIASGNTPKGSRRAPTLTLALTSRSFLSVERRQPPSPAYYSSRFLFFSESIFFARLFFLTFNFISCYFFAPLCFKTRPLAFPLLCGRKYIQFIFLKFDWRAPTFPNSLAYLNILNNSYPDPAGMRWISLFAAVARLYIRLLTIM